MAAVQSGTIKVSARDLAITASLGGTSGPSLREALLLRTGGSIKSQRAAMLRYWNRAVEAARLPPEVGYAQFRQLDATAKDQPVLVRVLVPALGKFSDAGQRSRAQLRCAVVAVAAERYRRAKGRWPETLDVLKEAGYLGALPADPYDGRPLRWRRLDDGAVVYAVGPDGEDNGGKLDRQNPVAPGTDVGFRLWDVGRRRQEPTPARPRD